MLQAWIFFLWTCQNKLKIKLLHMIQGHRCPLSLHSCESWLSCDLAFLQMFLWIGGCSANGLAGTCGPCGPQRCFLAHLKRPAAVFQFIELPATLFFFTFSVMFEHYWKFSPWRWLIGGIFSNLAVQPSANCPKPLVGIELWRQRTNECRRLTWAARWFFLSCTGHNLTSCPVCYREPSIHTRTQTNTHFHAQAEYTRQNKHPHSLS